MLEFLSFCSVEGFHNLCKYYSAFPENIPIDSKYRAKIKLHGTNAAIRIGVDGEVVAQSRSQIITESNDNCGFARWVKQNEDYFKSLRNENQHPYLKDKNITVFGEFCGNGIQSGTALNLLPNKILAVFAIFVGDTETGKFIIEPNDIYTILGHPTSFPPDFYVIPWEGLPFIVDFKDREALQTVADTLNKTVNDIEPCDPFIKATFNVEGVCEGIVCFPYKNPTPLADFETAISYKEFENLVFKAKGDKHKVVHKQTNSVQIDPTILESVDAFIKMFCTDNRFEQGMTTLNNDYQMKNMGAFLKWVQEDIKKESKAELEASKLTFDKVQKSVQTAARTWFSEKNKKI